jgi:hypothetical protein
MSGRPDEWTASGSPVVSAAMHPTLVVMGAHVHRGWTPLLLSIAESVPAHASCPVRIVRSVPELVATAGGNDQQSTAAQVHLGRRGLRKAQEEGVVFVGCPKCQIELSLRG